MIRKIYLSIFLICIVSISMGQSKRNLLRNGNQAYTNEDYLTAENYYQKSLDKDEDYFKAEFNLANAIYKQEEKKEEKEEKDYTRSLNRFEALKDKVVTKQDLAKIYHNLGNVFLKEEKIKDAIEAYKNALRINPNDEETRYNLAYANKKRKNQENQQQDQENQQQDQENQQQDQENQQQDQENQQQDQENQQQDQENQQQDQENQQQDQENQQQDQEEGMSKEDAEKILELIEEEEKKLQEKRQKKNKKGKRKKVEKDW